MNADRTRSRPGQGLLLALWLTIVAPGCGGVVFVSPTPVSHADATVIVRVLTRNGPRPIHGALVRHGSAGSYTDQGGEATVAVAAGSDTTIAVSAAGYQGMSASGIVHNDERWTFYLETLPIERQP